MFVTVSVYILHVLKEALQRVKTSAPLILSI